MSVRIHLVVTGDTEYLALGEALARIFAADDVEFTSQQVNGFTSTRLTKPAMEATKASELVDAMFAAIDVGGQSADYAIALDDLELANADQVDIVLAHARKAVALCVGAPDEVEAIQRGRRRQYRHLATTELRRDAMRNRCSFHLAAPMLESWFFGENAALSRARVNDLSRVQFDKTARDLEGFTTADSAFLVPPTRALRWAVGSVESRARHPKHYLSYLLDPTGTSPRRDRYREKTDGRAALEALDWDDVTTPPSHAKMVAALVTDVAAMVGVELPFDAGAIHPALALRNDGCLRNVEG